MFDELDGDATVSGEFQERISARVLDFVKSEIQKDEVKQKLLCFMDPVVNHMSRSMMPYLTSSMVIIMLILVCQGYLVFRLWMVQKTLLEH